MNPKIKTFNLNGMKDSFKELSKEFLHEIKTILKQQLEIRGIFTPLTITIAENKKKQAYFSVTSDPFQTTPVLFKYIRIQSIDGKIFCDQIDPCIKFSIPIYFACETYELEIADFKLFTLNGSIDPDIGAVHNISIINAGMFYSKTFSKE